MKIGAQLYTVRDFCKTTEDFAETLKKIAGIGYTTVQVSGTCAYEPDWLAEQLKVTGLRCVITHVDSNKLKEEPMSFVQKHKVFHCQYIGIGALPGGVTGLAKFDRFVTDYLPIAKTIVDNGCYLMYHNHHFEFNHIEPGVTYLEKLAEVFPTQQMGFTLDTYWVQIGGGNPAEWIHWLSGRVPCIHLKDLIMNGTEQRMASVGSGNINFAPILSAAEAAGTEYLLVEQDDCYGKDPFEELTSSYRYLKAQGLS